MSNIATKVLPSFLIVVLLISCQSPGQKFIQRFDAFVARVTKDSPDYAVADWDRTDHQFEQLMEDYDRIKRGLEASEKEHVEHQVGKYLALRTKAEAKGFLEDLEGGLQRIEGFLEELGID